MSEIMPQFTYSPEGVLTVGVNASEATGEEEYLAGLRSQIFEELSTQDGVEVREEGETTYVSAEIPSKFNDAFKTRNPSQIDDFLQLITNIVPIRPNDSIDRVISLPRIIFGATINHQFQRWLDNQGLDEDTAKNTAMAMALPFVDHRKRAAKGFRFDEARGRGSDGWFFDVIVQQGEFSVSSIEVKGDAAIHKTGSARWSDVELRTFGNCACWGVPGDERSYLHIEPGSKALYDMLYHNIDTADQSLSMILGLGALAYRAAQYEGTEDIFAGVEWRTETYPRIKHLDET